MTGLGARLSVQDDGDRSVQVADHDRDLLTYVYAPDDAQLESPRPYFHPVRTLGGDMVTLYRPHDHVWHKGIAWSLPNVGPHNFWGGPNYVRDQGYVQLENDGSMDHDGFTRIDVTDERVAVSHRLVWHAQPATGQPVGTEVVHEARSFTVTVPSDDAWVLTFSSTMTNVSGERLDIGSPTTEGRENAGYGGLFWRGPRSFAGGTILTPGHAGGEEIRGTRAEWMAFTGQQDGSARFATVLMVDDAANPHHPPQWFARNEWFAGVNPAPFFSEKVPFGDGERLRFRYAVVIADGEGDVERAGMLAELGRAALRAEA